MELAKISAAATTGGGGATANSAIFTMLSPELRRLILVDAFGGCTVHVQHWQNRRFGCVCHRRPDCDDVVNPATDDCMKSPRRSDWLAEGKKHALGATGWVLSCRQAYVEGAEVLHGSNTFHLRGGDLTSGLTRFIPAPRLSAVTSVEWVLDSRYLEEEEKSNELNRRPESLFRGVPQALPGLQRLYIGFSRNVCFWGAPYPQSPKDRFLFYTEHILPLLDGMARDFGNRLKELEVGFPMSVFYAHFCLGLGKGYKFQIPHWRPAGLPQGGYYPRKRIWRPILTSEARVDAAVADTDTTGGYWIGATESDMPDGWMVTMPRYWE